jgi:hypothetical protein
MIQNDQICNREDGWVAGWQACEKKYVTVLTTLSKTIQTSPGSPNILFRR